MSYDTEFTSTLVVHLEDVLQTVVETFGQASITIPDLRYIATGQTVHDCEQVTVSLQQLYIGPPGDQATEPQRCEGPRSAAVIIEIVRCIPTPNGRTGQIDHQAQALVGAQQAVDAWMLLEAATKMSVYGILADVTPGQPQGGFQATTMTLTMTVL